MKKQVLSTFVFCLVIILTIVIYLSMSTPNINLKEEYTEYVNLYSSKEYNTNIVIIKEEDQISYFIEVGSGYVVSIGGNEFYDTTLYQELNILPEYENDYIDLLIKNNEAEVVDTYKFYYSIERDKLDFMQWNQSTSLGKILLFVGVGLFIWMMVILLSNVRKKEHLKYETKKNLSIWEKFKKASLFTKFCYFIVFLFYLIVPIVFQFFFVFIIAALIVFYVSGIKNKIIALFSFSFSLIMGVICFFLLYIFFVPEAQLDYGYQVPETNLSVEAYELYCDIIDNADLYTKEPVAYFENDQFTFIVLRTYIEWTYTSGDEKIEVVYQYRLINNDESNYNIILKNDERIIKQVKVNEDDSKEIFLDNIKVDMVYFQLRDYKNNDLIYSSEKFNAETKFDDLELEVFYGFQHMENESKVLLLTLLFMHIASIVFMLLFYAFRNSIFNHLKKPLYIKKKEEDCKWEI